jgi:hypothetical protein
MALILYAPNVHSGGGRVLLEALHNDCGSRFDHAILDRRLGDVSQAFSDITSRLSNKVILFFAFIVFLHCLPLPQTWLCWFRIGLLSEAVR